jgi:hypothetical protein
MDVVVRIINGQQEFQTGITVLIIWLIFKEEQKRIEAVCEHTVDSNGHRLSQDVSICANKGRNSAQGIELEVFDVLNGRSSLDELNIEVIGLCDSQQHR